MLFIAINKLKHQNMPVPESIPDPQTTTQDPSLLGGQQQIGIADPTIRALASDPDSLNGAERQATIIEAKRLSRGMTNIIVTDKEGVARWGHEYPLVFTFDGNIRGSVEKVHKDRAQRSPAVQAAGLMGDESLRGVESHVIFEMDDGQSILIRRTNDAISASKQTFDLLATGRETGHEGKSLQRTELDTSMLKDIIVVPGERLVLGKDPVTGKRVQTRGRVLSITAFGMTDDRRVDPSHPWIQRPEYTRDVIQKFDEKLQTARKQQIAPNLGSRAITND